MINGIDMLYFLTVAYVALYFIRPFEWVGFLIGTPVFLISGIISIVVICFILLSKKDASKNIATDIAMTGFVVAIILSHVSHGYLGGAFDNLKSFLPSIVGYILVRLALDTPKKIHIFICVLVLIASFLGYEGVLQYQNGFSHGGMEPFLQYHTNEDGMRVLESIRIRWYGVFNDPNDLGLVFVMAAPLLLGLLYNRKYLLPLICSPFIFAGLYLTNSRGSMLAALAGLSAFLVLKYRSFKGALFGLILVSLLVTFGPSRMGEMSASESSAYGRIDSWYAGYQMLISSPLFGVGAGMYTDFNNLTAHNSFVLVLAELGLFGAFFFTAMFYLPMKLAWKNVLINNQTSVIGEGTNYFCAVLSSLIGLLVSMFFLSRSYFAVPYMLVGLVMASSKTFNTVSIHEINFATVDEFDTKNILKILIGEITFIYLMVKVLL